MLEPRERYINPYTDFGFKFLDAAEIARFTPEERWAYEESVKVWRDNTNVANFAVSEAEKKGKAIGEAKKSIEIAQRMKAMGLDSKIIVEATQLSPEQIEKL
jgi:predicted transposase/invertase (TIGR01784 family)